MADLASFRPLGALKGACIWRAIALTGAFVTTHRLSRKCWSGHIPEETAPMGAYPKPDSQRARTNKPQFDWVRLPESGNKTIPPMPYGNWHERTVAWWAQHWSHPCAVMWRTDDPCHERLAQFADILNRTGVMHGATTLTELRQLEDRLGLNPKARLQLRWLIVPDEQADAQPSTVELAVVLPMGDEKAKRQRKDPRVS